jgi:hypothetical protein
MKKFFAYIRVPSFEREVNDNSLQGHRREIKRFARRHRVAIARWIEEEGSGADRGPVFLRMVRLLRSGVVDGLIMHKALRDPLQMIRLEELRDRGIEVLFARRIAAGKMPPFEIVFISYVRKQLTRSRGARSCNATSGPADASRAPRGSTDILAIQP